MSESTPTAVEKTIINAQTTIKGEISFAGPAVICGRIEGQIRAQDELEITAEGIVDGDIYGAIVDIQGTVKGNVTASRTTRLGPNAKLVGELRASNLAISEGATFVGKVCVGAELPAAPAKPEPKHETKQVITASSRIDRTERTERSERPLDPAAALQSRLAELQDSNSDNDAAFSNEPVRIVAGAVNNLKRASIVAAH